MLPFFVAWMGLGCCQGIIVDDRAASNHGRILMPLAPHGWHPCRYDDLVYSPFCTGYIIIIISNRKWSLDITVIFLTQWDFLWGVHPL